MTLMFEDAFDVARISADRRCIAASWLLAAVMMGVGALAPLTTRGADPPVAPASAMAPAPCPGAPAAAAAAAVEAVWV